MRIWLITVGEPLPTDGGNVRLYRTGLLAELLNRQGHEVVWWTSTFDHMAKKLRFTSDTVIDSGERYRLILLHSLAYGANISLSRILNHTGIARRFSALVPHEPKPDIIVTSYPTLELSLLAVKYGQRHGIPVVVDVRDLWPDIFIDLFPGLLRPLGRLLLQPYFCMAKAIFSQATAIIGITPKIVAWGLDYAGRSPTQWDIDFPLAYPDKQPSAEALAIAEQFWEQQGVSRDGDAFTACFFGTLGRQFDIETVIKAARMLEKQNRNIRVVLCGTGDNLEKYKQLAGTCSNIIFPGWVGAAEIWGLMRRANAGLAPYYSTPDFEMSIPNKIIEYLSAGSPIISSLQGTVAEMFSQHSCGVTYRQGNPHELANILVDLQNQPLKQATMSKNARSLYEENFAADKVYGKFAAYLEDIVNHYKAGE